MATPDSIAAYLLKGVNRAVREFALLADGDHVAVGLSGGKDSRALLTLLARGVDFPGRYRLTAIHIEGRTAGLPAVWPHLEPWLRDLGVAYHVAPLILPAGTPLPLECFGCARLRRKALFEAAAQLGCNKVALGHHADDAAITTLMNLIYKGQVESMAPRREYFGGQMTLIRPLIYLPEAALSRYARACGWQFPPELECPHREQARRTQIAHFLRGLREKEREQVRANLWRLALLAQ